MTKNKAELATITSQDTSRKLAFNVLCRFEKNGTERLKAESLLQEQFLKHNENALTSQDRAFSHALVMGTLRHWFRLNEWIKILTQRELKQIEPSVRVLLRLGIFQLYGLSHVPAYAAVNTTVELAKAQNISLKTVQFINAVLRSAQRRLESDGFEIPPSDVDFKRHLEMNYGWTATWQKNLLKNYTEEELLGMAIASQTPPPLMIRVNTLRNTVQAYQALLLQSGLTAYTPMDDLPECLILPDFSGSPRHLPGYDEGLFYVQDSASMRVAYWLNLEPESTVLDLCAAPGSKTTQCAALMNNQGSIIAIEPKKERMALLEENISRLGVSNTLAVLADALIAHADGPLSTQYDRVLVDAPCSGTGTLRRHPEILLHVRNLKLSTFTGKQMALLKKGFECLKPGGILVYSTCSVLAEENHELVKRFLASHLDASLQAEMQSLINENADGFYTARISKKPA